MKWNIHSKIKLNIGIKIPRIGFGTWKLKGKKAYQPIKWALKAGYRLIDTAALYGNEKYVGKAIRDSEIPREDIFLTSKVWDSDLGYKKTLDAFERSLDKLNLEYLDLYLIHWPRKLRKESWKALEELYQNGRVKAIGVANFAIKHLKELLNRFEITPAINQFELHPFLFSERKELIDFCKNNKIQIEAYSPLTHGKKLNHPTLQSIAEKYNKSTTQILLRWGLQHDFIVIPKSGNKNHIKENASLFDFELSKEDMNEINSIEGDFRLLYDTSTWD
jgi:diketogulonate reductase-like aldo/keto reductase